MFIEALAVSALLSQVPPPTSTEAQHSTAAISGTVRDATGAALANASVTIRGTATRAAHTVTDGRFELVNLPAGEYILTAAADGFATTQQTLRLASRERTTVLLTLTLALHERTVVTAGKNGDRDLQTTPLAASVLKGDDLARNARHSVAQLAGMAPSVTFSQNSDFAQLTIRGIGSSVVFAGTDPSSAVYLDGVYLARPVMVLGDFVALDRVEVVRGPQGTLYGRNAVGGAINLVTKPPTSEFEASAALSAGNLNMIRTDARVSGPIGRKTLLGSAAVVRGVRDGFVRDLNHPDHPLGGEDVTALQGKLHWVANRHADVVISADATEQDPVPLTYAKVLFVKPGFQVDNPADLHQVRASTLAEGHIRQGGAAVRLTLRLPAMTTLTSLTAYRALDYRVVNDADVTELDLTAVDFRERQHQWSQELTLSRQRSRLSWVVGLFLLSEADRQPVAIDLGASRSESRLVTRVDASSAAAFGQSTLALTRRLSVTAGLRYTSEHKTIANAGALFSPGPSITPVAGTAYAYTDARSHDAWTPRAGVEARLNDGLFAYATATRGFKSGGFNMTSRQAGLGYAPEWAWSYEAGFKMTPARSRATLNLAAFHMNYSDLQVQTAIRPGVIDISNAAQATIRGIEVEGAVRLPGAVHAGGHLAWLDARYDRYVAVGVGGATGDVAGHRLGNAPEWAGRLWLEATGALGRGGWWLLRADARSQATVFFTPFNDAIQRQAPYAVLDVTGEVGPASRVWTVGAWARNLTDTNYITGTFSTPPPAIGGRPGLPREGGVRLAIRWSR